jgi:alanyl-tRNA synthetase
VKDYKARAQSSQAAGLKDEVREVSGLHVLAKQLQADNPNDLRTLAARIFKGLENGLLVAGAVFGGKVTLVAMASEAAIEKGYKAGDIVRNLTSQLGGKGGGKPDFAMGGGSEPGKLRETLDQWLESVTENG